MPTKTIYVSDENLWKQAKRLAGRDGLSKVINSAIKEFVATQLSRERGYSRFEFEIFWDRRLGAPTQVIGFEGKLLFGATVDFVTTPFEFGSDQVEEAFVEVYRTRAGKILLLAEPGSVDKNAFAMWESHSSLNALSRSNVVELMFPEARDLLLQSVSAGLGKEDLTWID